MKKLFALLFMMFVMPIAIVSAHGSAPDTPDASEAGMMGEGMMSQEMQDLMKTFLMNGSLSSEEADRMVAHMQEMMKMHQGGGMGMMGMQQGDQRGYMAGGMMNNDLAGGMIPYWVFHIMLWVTLVVWLLVGLVYLLQSTIAIKRKRVAE